MNTESGITPVENSNTRIWGKICETDPFRTKNFNKGYRGTAINPTYIYEKLTACFGPCGVGWGFDILKDEYKTGHGEEITHSTTVALWYKNDGVKSEPVPGIGGTAYVFKDKNGWHTDEDASKKSLTDALTKAAQLLGMSADIFSGLYDDCKYVAELRRKYSQEKNKEESPQEPTSESKSKTTNPSTPSSEIPSGNGQKISDQEAIDLRRLFTTNKLGTKEQKEILGKHGFATALDVTKFMFPKIQEAIKGKAVAA